MDRKALIGLLSGVTVVIATLFGVAMFNTRAAEGAVDKVSARDCALNAKPAEPGYGVASSEACAHAN